MSFSRVFVFLQLFIYCSTTFGKCPQGSLEYLERAECIYPVDAEATYSQARKICKNFGGQIITIRDIFENVMAGTQAQTTLTTNSQSYIGVTKQTNGTWTNDDGTMLEYQNWATGTTQRLLGKNTDPVQK